MSIKLIETTLSHSNENDLLVKFIIANSYPNYPGTKMAKLFIFYIFNTKKNIFFCCFYKDRKKYAKRKMKKIKRISLKFGQ